MEKAKEANRNETHDIIWSAVHKKRVRNKAVPQAVSISQLNTHNVLTKVNSNTIHDRGNLKNISKKDTGLISMNEKLDINWDYFLRRL